MLLNLHFPAGRHRQKSLTLYSHSGNLSSEQTCGFDGSKGTPGLIRETPENTDAQARLPAASRISRDLPSPRQIEILRTIERHVREEGYPPTVREIGEAVGLRSTNGVAEHLRALIRKGYLSKQDMKSRALVPTPKCYAAIGSMRGGREGMRGVVEVPLLGRVAAGVPILAEENVEDVVRLDSYFLGGGRKVCALRVQGDSMIEADGILNGDTLFVRQQDTASRGDDGGLPDRRRGHRQTLLPGGRSHPAAAFEPQHGQRSTCARPDFKRGQIAQGIVGRRLSKDGRGNGHADQGSRSRGRRNSRVDRPRRMKPPSRAG